MERCDELAVADLDDPRELGGFAVNSRGPLTFLAAGLARVAGQDHRATAHESLERGFKWTRANLRALQVAQQCDRPVRCLGRFAHVGGDLTVRCVVAVREVQAGHVHAGMDHRAQHRGRRARRPDGAYDARAAYLSHRLVVHEYR